MNNDTMDEILDIAKDAGMQVEQVLTIEENKRSLEIGLRIVYDKLHSLRNVEAVLRKHNLDKVLSPYALDCGDRMVERTYIKECDNIIQYLKGIRDEKRIMLEKLTEGGNKDEVGTKESPITT